MTIVGKNEMYRWENLAGLFLMHKLLAPLPPPPLLILPCPRLLEHTINAFVGVERHAVVCMRWPAGRGVAGSLGDASIYHTPCVFWLMGAEGDATEMASEGPGPQPLMLQRAVQPKSDGNETSPSSSQRRVMTQ